ncbi:MAG: hypothetical protein KF791_14340 [Verrucomicrobiae bacterium]|nr:hypothetical protein [Verrucomicrobiae bacterium]
MDRISQDAERAVLLHLHHFLSEEMLGGHPVLLLGTEMLASEHDRSGMNRLTLFREGLAGDRRFNVIIEVMHPDRYASQRSGREFAEMPSDAQLPEVLGIRFHPLHPDFHIKVVVAHAALPKGSGREWFNRLLRKFGL